LTQAFDYFLCPAEIFVVAENEEICGPVFRFLFLRSAFLAISTPFLVGHGALRNKAKKECRAPIAGTSRTRDRGGVANMARVGGFITGVLLIYAFRSRMLTRINCMPIFST